MRCAFLTMDNTEGWSIDAGMCIPHLQAMGWLVDWVPWRQPVVNWDAFDLVYLAAPWDYPEDIGLFIQVLEDIKSSRAVLVNSADIVNWNIAKTYLRDLETRGAAIVPSLWYERFTESNLSACFEQLECEKIIIKPIVSTNASNTFLLSRTVERDTINQLETVFSNRPFLVQPFIKNIRTEGEYSLFYMDGIFSHAIRKIPKSGDFRVQEEHGGNIIAAEPEKRLHEAGKSVVHWSNQHPCMRVQILCVDRTMRIC